jgi:hypothetical protein
VLRLPLALCTGVKPTRPISRSIPVSNGTPGPSRMLETYPALDKNAGFTL